MKKITLFSLAAAAVIFTACGEETKTEIEKEDKIEVSQTVNEDTVHSSYEGQSNSTGGTDAVDAAVEQITDEVSAGVTEVVDEAVEAVSKRTDPFGNPIPPAQ
jgi:hypothetical protein